MTTIAPFAAGSYQATRTSTQLVALKNQLNDLSNQLSSGQVSQTYGGLGSGRSAALAAQSTLSALAGYASGITVAQTRTDLAVTSLTQVATLGTTAKATLDNGLQSVAATTTSGRAVALSNLETALDTLNQSAAGNYLFGGANTTTQPVLDSDTVLNGATNSDGTTQAGLKAVVAERVQAQVGPNGNGRLTQTTGGSGIQITEEANDATRGQFGFTLAGAPTTTGTAFSTAFTPSTASAPATLSVNLATQPAVGDAITVKLNMADGTTTSVTLTAAANADPASATSFTIGSSVADTVANLSGTLARALKGAAGSTLAVNATAAAASTFFTGSAQGGPSGAGVMPQRIAYDGANNPIGLRAATPQDTVLWYQGENTYADATTPTSALDTQSVQVSGTSKVGTGARASDGAIQNVLAGLATMALALPTATDTNPNATYLSVVNKAGTLLSSASQGASVQDIVTHLSVAATRLSAATASNTATQNTVQATLDGIEQAPTEEVVAKLLDVQNRLQASYQVTASLSKLSLVNYIS